MTDRRRWESALFLKVRDEIETGNLAIEATRFRDAEIADRTGRPGVAVGLATAAAGGEGRWRGNRRTSR